MSSFKVICVYRYGLDANQTLQAPADPAVSALKMAQQIGNEPVFLSLVEKGATSDGDVLMELICQHDDGYFSSRCSAALIRAGYNLDVREDGSSPLAAAVKVQDWYVPCAP